VLASITFYSVMLAVHIAAVVVTFGGIFLYPVIVPWVRATHPEALAAVHAGQARVSRMVIGPGMVVVLIAGIYLASKADVWSESWVSIPLAILLIVGGIGGAIIAPGERRLSELAERGGGAEYDALAGRVFTMQVAAMVLVLVAVFFMTVKP
jgi:uncharacterized membrane protein